MALKIINDRRGLDGGVYVAGWNIAPNVALIKAQTYEQAWCIFCEQFADSLPDCDCDTECECEWVDGAGKKSTLDVVIRTIRPSGWD